MIDYFPLSTGMCLAAFIDLSDYHHKDAVLCRCGDAQPS